MTGTLATNELVMDSLSIKNDNGMTIQQNSKNIIKFNANENNLSFSSNVIFEQNNFLTTLNEEKRNIIQNIVDKCLIHVYDVENGFQGSAFFVNVLQLDTNYDYIATATHMITDFNGDLVSQTAFHCMTPFNKIMYVNPQINTVCYSITGDICILKVPKEVGRSKINISNMSNTKVGDTLFCAGFTAGKDYQNVTVCNIKDLSYETDITPVNYILVDSVTMMGGNSGGPWLNSTGELVGIASWGYVKNLPEHSHDSNGSVIGNVSISVFADSFDILGVSSKSLLRLIDKYILAGSPSTPFKYRGMGIRSINNNLANLQLQTLAYNVNYDPWHNTVSGCWLNSAVGNIPLYSIVNELEVNGSYKTIGTLNSQYKNYDLDVFYGDKTQGLNVRWLNGSDDNIVEENLPLRERTDAEDEQLISLSTIYKKHLIAIAKKNLKELKHE